MKYQTFTSRQRRRKRQVETIQRFKNNLVQTNLKGEQIPTKDSEFFGHFYPDRINTNCSIITYQNIGQQPRFGFTFKSKETSKAFKNSKASVAMYNETGLNEKQLERYDKFNDRMRKFNPKSKSYHSHNHHLSSEASWNVPGGTAITLDENLHSHYIPNKSRSR